MNANWSTCKLRDIADVRVSNVDKKTSNAETPVKLCNYMDVYSNDYVTKSIDFMTASASKSEIERFRLQAGDVIITKDSETQDDIGVPAVVTDSIDRLVCGYHLALIRPVSGAINSIFLAKQLTSAPIARYFSLNASGSTRFGLTVSVIEDALIPVASKPVQAKIAEILFTVDQAIEQTEALIAKQQRIKTGLMQDLLTRGIDEHGNLRFEETHQFKDSQLGRVPRCWRVRSLGAALHRAKGHIQTGPFGSQLHAHEYVHEGIPVVMPQDIVDRSISIGSIARVPRNRADDLRRHRTEYNDVVFSRRGDLSRAAAIGEREVGWLCGTGCFLLRVSPDAIHAPWLVDAYRHHHVQRQIDANAIGSTMPSLNNSVMEQLKVAFPGINEQREIARHREELDATIRTLLDHLLKMRHIKTGLMQQLLTGNRLVTDRVTDNTA